ncbi:roadblock/LC7 domain-containing protein [Nonomuraea purpurea]|uniref:Roadblock/LC7 domain-containing protein n=1 Tax=Nonomuraea purpurea TaxID=1849276 RepID=A0ABV8GM01_9ACTN
MTHSNTNLDWLITDFVQSVPGVAHAALVSADGLPLAISAGFPPARADQLAAIASGLASLTQGAATLFSGGKLIQTVIEMQRGLMLNMAISDGSCLAVLVAPDCDMGLVAYQMTLLADRAGQVLTPALRARQTR